MNSSLKLILDYLNREHVRATYGAVGEALGIPAIAVGTSLGDRCPEASWIVSAETGQPTGYAPGDIHPLLEGSPIITSGADLVRRLAGFPSRKREPGTSSVPPR